MLFLIEYDRKQGQLIAFDSFDDLQRQQAEDVRLDLELKQNRLGIEHEIVLLQAATEAALRRTHRRYFEDLKQLATAL